MISKIYFFLILFFVISFSIFNNVEAVSSDQRDLMQEHMDHNFPKTEQNITMNVSDTSTNYDPYSAISQTGEMLFGFLPTKLIFSKPFALVLIIILKISIVAFWISRKLSRKKRTKVLVNQNMSDGKILVTPKQYSVIQEFEKKFSTEGKDDPEEFLHKKSGAKLIDASSRGNELYSISILIPDKSIKILKYRDPSTVQLYISIVPFEYENADEAMAWKLHLTKKEYARLKNEG